MFDAQSIRVLASLLCGGAVMTCDAAAAQGVQGTIPNLSSAEFPWISTTPEYQAPPTGLGPITYDKAHPHMGRTPNNRGEIIEKPLPLADLNNPNLKPWVVEFLRKANDVLLAGRLRYASRASCMPAGVPMFWIYGAGIQPIWFVQTSDKIVIVNLGDNQTRHVYMNVPHSADLKPSWYGESVGHYAGGELVIDTIGFNGKTMLDDSYNVPHSTQLHVVERVKPSEDGKLLEVNFTIDDPGAFNAPWSGIVRYRRGTAVQRLYEQPCAENNIDPLGKRYDSPIATTPDF
jgi:hypothetical protein